MIHVALACEQSSACRIEQVDSLPLLFGRSPEASVTLTNEESHLVSWEHFSINKISGSLHIYDLGSSNGTYVNGVQIAPRTATPITSNDAVRIGKSGLWVLISESSDPSGTCGGGPGAGIDCVGSIVSIAVADARSSDAVDLPFPDGDTEKTLWFDGVGILDSRPDGSETRECLQLSGEVWGRIFSIESEPIDLHAGKAACCYVNSLVEQSLPRVFAVPSENGLAAYRFSTFLPQNHSPQTLLARDAACVVASIVDKPDRFRFLLLSENAARLYLCVRGGTEWETQLVATSEIVSAGKLREMIETEVADIAITRIRRDPRESLDATPELEDVVNDIYRQLLMGKPGIAYLSVAGADLTIDVSASSIINRCDFLRSELVRIASSYDEDTRLYVTGTLSRLVPAAAWLTANQLPQNSIARGAAVLGGHVSAVDAPGSESNGTIENAPIHNHTGCSDVFLFLDDGNEIHLANGSTLILGRSDDADVRFDPAVYSMVSSAHASLTTRSGCCLLRDLGSSNGTFIGSERITTPRLLKDQARFSLGATGPTVTFRKNRQ